MIMTIGTFTLLTLAGSLVILKLALMALVVVLMINTLRQSQFRPVKVTSNLWKGNFGANRIGCNRR
jgi:hypothetical protein